MKRVLAIAVVAVLSGWMSHSSIAAVRLPVDDGQVGWVVPLDRTMGVRICQGPRSSGFNISGERPGAMSLTLVSTVRNGEVVDLSGYDDMCDVVDRGSIVFPENPSVEESVAYLVDLAERSARIADEALGFLAVIDHHAVPDHLMRFATKHRDEEVRADAVFLATLRLGDGALPFLRDVLRNDSSREVRERAVFSLSQVDEPEAGKMLERIAADDRDGEVRTQAVFWLTESRGAAALPFLRSITSSEESDEVVEAAVFGISRIDDDEAAKVLVDLAKNHSESEVRERALFWLSQKASEHLESVVEEIFVRDEDEDVLEAAVFAVSQLPDGESIPILERLAKTHRSSDVREKAIFWLGQKDDPRAVAVLESIILN